MRRALRLSSLLAAALLTAAVAGCKPRATPGASGQGAASAAAPGSTSTPLAASSAAPARPRPSPRRTGSALARTVASDALFVADEDHAALRRVPLPLDAAAAVGETRLPGPPAQVLVRDGEVWVTVRDPGLLVGFAIEGGGVREVARIELPADAWGMGLSPDEKTMVVTSAWTHAVSVVDLGSRTVTRTLDVAREPRGVVFAQDGTHAYVTHLVGTALTRVDLGGDGPRARPIALPAAPLRTPRGSAAGASLAYAAVLSPDGRRLFVPRHALGTYSPVSHTSFGWGISQAAWFGSTTVDILMTERDTPLALARPTSVKGVFGQELPGEPRNATPEPVPPASPAAVFVQPRDVLYRSASRTLLIASEGMASIYEHDALSPDPSLGTMRRLGTGQEPEKFSEVYAHGAAPQGLALSEDEDTVWYFARGTYEVGGVSFEGKSPPLVRVADDTLGAEASVGRRLFYTASDDKVSGGLGCAGCHPEGRDDGFVWHEAREKEHSRGAVFVGHPAALTQAADEGRARQTPMLAGRLDAPGPYGWHGQNRNLDERLLEGFRLHRWSGRDTKPDATELYRLQRLVAFLRKGGLRPPPRLDRPLTPEEERGRAIFASEQAGCATCHPASAGYTTRVATPLRTPLPTRAGFAPDEDEAFKVPSLLHVGGTPPYYHDGSAPTLEALVEQNGQRMGQTDHLNAADKKALVAFLRTL